MAESGYYVCLYGTEIRWSSRVLNEREALRECFGTAGGFALRIGNRKPQTLLKSFREEMRNKLYKKGLGYIPATLVSSRNGIRILHALCAICDTKITVLGKQVERFQAYKCKKCRSEVQNETTGAN